MDRRTFLALVAGSLGATSGCAGDGRGRQPGVTSPAPDPVVTPGDAGTAVDPAPGTAAGPPASDTDAGPTLAERGFPSTVCSDEIRHGGGIRAVVDPAFGPDWSDSEVPEKYAETGELSADAAVVGVADGDRARAYPLAVLWWHEVVNDSFGGPLLVTYCPICRSGMVAARRVAGEATVFGVSGILWEPPDLYTAASEQDGTVFGASTAGRARIRDSGNLVLYDEATRSYWSQLLARAICGPRRGETLSIRPSTLATWGDWRREHPGTDVLLPPPASRVMSV